MSELPMSLDKSKSDYDIIVQERDRLLSEKELLSAQVHRLTIENSYLLARNNIVTKKNNKGEKDEVLIMIDLFHFNQTKNFDSLINIFGDEASNGIYFIDMNTNMEITDINDLSKAKSSSKADCMIKMNKTGYVYSISIKSKDGANPAILNHTPRVAKVFQTNGVLYAFSNHLDCILAEYIQKRMSGTIGEDAKISDLECLKTPWLKNGFVHILEYFIFNGTGKGDSSHKANSIITYENKEINFKKCVSTEEKNQYINSIYEDLILSLRDKGMPKEMTDYCKPWVFNDIQLDGSVKYKGSLHIRMK